jgi:hypothetical protein
MSSVIAPTNPSCRASWSERTPEKTGEGNLAADEEQQRIAARDFFRELDERPGPGHPMHDFRS